MGNIVCVRTHTGVCERERVRVCARVRALSVYVKSVYMGGDE